MLHSLQILVQWFALFGAATAAAAAVKAHRHPSSTTLNQLGISEAAFARIPV